MLTTLLTIYLTAAYVGGAFAFNLGSGRMKDWLLWLLAPVTLPLGVAILLIFY